MTVIKEIFGTDKAIIAMAHFPPLPGQPQYDAAGGVAALRASLERDLEILVSSGVDGVMFCNEGDRPYTTAAGPEATATMAAVIATLTPGIGIPFGVDILWDPCAAIALGHAVGATFVREVFTGTYAGDFGFWEPETAAALRYRRALGAENLKLFFNITAEFASAVAPRSMGLTARSVLLSSLPDALCVSGVVTGSGVDAEMLQEAKEAVGDAVAVIANTGVRPETVGTLLGIADACIVGTAFKRDGDTWNPVESDRVDRLLKAARESGHWTPVS